MSGLELCQKLDPKALGIVFGFIASEGTGSMRAQAEEAGAAFLLVKPLSAATFKDIVGAALPN